MLNLTVEDLGEISTLRCRGRIVRGHETALLCAAVQRHGRTILLDLSQVEAIDAAGIGALISLQAAGVYLILMNPSKAVRDVLRITGVDTVFEIREEPAEEAFDRAAAWPFPCCEPAAAH